MGGNSFGKLFTVTTFGESHGEALGCIIDGCPAGIDFDFNFLQEELDRRKPGSNNNAAVTARKESDTAKVLSGVFEGKTTGTPIAIVIYNENQHSSDYSNIKDKFRPGHADYTYQMKYGIRDYRGGGRSSGRETAARVAAGAVAKMLLFSKDIFIKAYTVKAAGIECTKRDIDQVDQNEMRAPDNETAKLWMEVIEEFRKEGNSTSGIVECTVTGLPAGLGEPVFDKADALLAQAILSIGAIKGIEFGKGFECANLSGKDFNDCMRMPEFEDKPVFTTNNAGGVLGGITNGNDLVFRAAVKPVPSIFLKQETVNTNFEECDILIEGRHDVCLCPRIVPVVEAMTAITLADLYLRNLSSRN